MKSVAAVLAAALTLPALFSGCAGRKPVPMPKTDYAPSQERASQAQAGLDRTARGEAQPQEPSRPAPAQAVDASLDAADEAQPQRAKVLKKDPVGCTWIESWATIRVGDQTQNQLHAAAVAQARQSAMQDFLGVKVESRFMDFQHESLRNQANVTESMLLTTRLGRIVDEKLPIVEEYRSPPGCRNCLFHVVLHTCIMPIPDDADKDFRVDLEISPRRNFVDGDEARLVVTANRDCSVYLYDVYEAGSSVVTSLIVPNEAVPEVRLKAGQTWTYPDESLQKRGVHLNAQLPEGKTLSTETIRLIASKSPLPRKVTDPAQGYQAIYKRLASLGDWTENAAAFTISQRQ